MLTLQMAAPDGACVLAAVRLGAVRALDRLATRNLAQEDRCAEGSGGAGAGSIVDG